MWAILHEGNPNCNGLITLSDSDSDADYFCIVQESESEFGNVIKPLHW